MLLYSLLLPTSRIRMNNISINLLLAIRDIMKLRSILIYLIKDQQTMKLLENYNEFYKTKLYSYLDK